MIQNKPVALVLAFCAGLIAIASTTVAAGADALSVGLSIFFALTAIILALPNTKEKGSDTTEKS